VPIRKGFENNTNIAGSCRQAVGKNKTGHPQALYILTLREQGGLLGSNHGLINYIDTTAKFRHLKH
jgi:hypothetical protein